MSRNQEIGEAGGGLPVLDVEGMVSRVDGNRELLREVVAMFLDAFPAQQAALGAAIGRGDVAEVTRWAHTIKGSVAFFASAPIVDLARDLESMGRAGDLSGAPETKAALDAMMVKLATALTAYAAADAEGGEP